MEKFFANLKRLLDPRPQPPAESTEQPTADRPPPLPESVPYRRPESTRHEQPESTPDQELASPEAAPADDVSEVRALLESVAEAPVAEPEPEAQLLLPAPEPTPILSEDQTPSSPSAPDEPSTIEDSVAPTMEDSVARSVEDSDARSDVVEGALVLTLATPAAAFTIARSAATIGRGQENTVRLDDISVSRRHARIAYRGGGYWLSDLGSMGGTWVDGVKLNAPRRIAAGQVIDIGVCRLTASLAAGPAQSELRKSASKPRSEVAEQARRRR